MMRTLVIIPARGGSKGIPRKNIKCLNGRPLLEYTLDVAKKLFQQEDICVSTDDNEIISLVEKTGLKVPFKRPDYLATDTAGTYEVLLHALKHYEDEGRFYDCIVLLQTTSPFREAYHVTEAMRLFTFDIDMVVSVKEVSANPYYNCFEENEAGYLLVSKGNGGIKRRQDAPKVWEYNGAVYVINVDSLKRMSLSEFRKIVKYPMDEISSMDIDTPLDWTIAELLIKQR